MTQPTDGPEAVVCTNSECPQYGVECANPERYSIEEDTPFGAMTCGACGERVQPA